MKIIRTFAIAIAVALVDCVSHAGLFDAIKSVANEAANVADEAAKITASATKSTEIISGREKCHHPVVRMRSRKERILVPSKDESTGLQRQVINVRCR